MKKGPRRVTVEKSGGSAVCLCRTGKGEGLLALAAHALVPGLARKSTQLVSATWTTKIVRLFGWLAARPPNKKANEAHDGSDNDDDKYFRHVVLPGRRTIDLGESSLGSFFSVDEIQATSY